MIINEHRGQTLKSDRERWDSRYSQEYVETPTPDPLLLDCGYLLTGGRALDLACGIGSNSIFIARKGYWVDALDTSIVALRRLQKESHQQHLHIGCVLTDLDYYPLPAISYDLIMVFHFFDKNLMGSIRAALKPGAILIYATFNHRHMSERPGFCQDYLVPLGGLRQFFPDLEAILDEEFYGENDSVSRFVAKNSR